MFQKLGPNRRHEVTWSIGCKTPPAHHQNCTSWKRSSTVICELLGLHTFPIKCLMTWGSEASIEKTGVCWVVLSYIVTFPMWKSGDTGFWPGSLPTGTSPVTFRDSPTRISNKSFLETSHCLQSVFCWGVLETTTALPLTRTTLWLAGLGGDDASQVRHKASSKVVQKHFS